MAVVRKKQQRNAEQTKERILNCAMGEFAKKGFDGARLDAIVKKAGVNINLVYHYFGSKEDLFLAVMEAAYTTMRAYHREMDIKDDDPAEAMRSLVRRTFRIFIDFPEIIGLLNSENVYEAKHIAKSEHIGELFNPLLSAIGEVLDRGVREGVFRSGVDPKELFISINGEGYFYLSNRYTLGFILHEDLLDKTRLAQREEHIVEVILSYLRYGAGQG